MCLAAATKPMAMLHWVLETENPMTTVLEFAIGAGGVEWGGTPSVGAPWAAIGDVRLCWLDSSRLGCQEMW